jgi:hypothetical protein
MRLQGNETGNHNQMTNSKSTANEPLRGALKFKDAQQYLGGLSKPTIHRLIERGLLKPNRKLRHLIFPIRELDRFLDEP